MATKNKSEHAYFYVLLNKMGIPTEDKRDFIIDYTDNLTDSLSELHEKYPAFYSDMIKHMEAVVKQTNTNSNTAEMDKLRKRVMASIGGYFKLTGQDHSSKYIKATACQATGYKSFNAIPKERLNNIYNAFTKMQKDFKAVGTINQEQLKRLALLN